jgi:hypothetical protein
MFFLIMKELMKAKTALQYMLLQSMNEFTKVTMTMNDIIYRNQLQVRSISSSSFSFINNSNIFLLRSNCCSNCNNKGPPITCSSRVIACVYTVQHKHYEMGGIAYLIHCESVKVYPLNICLLI